MPTHENHSKTNCPFPADPDASSVATVCRSAKSARLRPAESRQARFGMRAEAVRTALDSLRMPSPRRSQIRSL